MTDELQHLESEHANALRDIELDRQRAMNVADAEYMAAAICVDLEYERRKADLLKGDRVVPAPAPKVLWEGNCQIDDDSYDGVMYPDDRLPEELYGKRFHIIITEAAS